MGNWLVLAQSNNWDKWPHRKGTGNDPHDRDTYPNRTMSGDYVFYHGTDLRNAKMIVRQRQIRPDNWGCIGINTTPSSAGTYGAIKGSSTKQPSAVVQIVVDPAWFESQDLTREIGGSGRDAWLIEGIPGIPPDAIKDISIYSVRGDRMASTSNWLIKAAQQNWPAKEE